MRRWTGAFSIVGIICFSGLAMAGPADFIWQNTQGFVSAENCQVGTLKSIPFAISEGDDTSAVASSELKNLTAAGRKSLLNRSLVRIADQKRKNGYSLVDIVGVSQNPQVPMGQSFAKRMDRGYLSDATVKNLENFVIEMKSGVPTKEFPNIKISTIGSFWQLMTDGDQPMAFRCRRGSLTTEFVMFAVYTANHSDPIARVGVSVEQTEIFKSILTHSPQEADQVLDSRMTRPPENLNQSLVTGLVTSKSSDESSPLEAVKEAGAIIRSKAKVSNTVVAPTATNSQSTEDDDGDEDAEDSSLKMIDSQQEYVVCINEDTLAVRDDSLENVLFRAERNETVIPFQSWDSADIKKKEINGIEYTFVKIQFPEREGQNVGWLAQEYVRLEGQCPVPKEEASAPLMPSKGAKEPIKGIDSPACCGFPTIQRPAQSYLTGMRRFKAGRSKGKRLHAACDLYRVHGEAAVSLADGKVANGLYKFYQGTYAIEVQYPGGFIARYGELTGKSVKKLKTGTKVKRGEIVGYIGTVNSGCCAPMLHFELYAGTKKGSLTTKGNKFLRRSDLIDPTSYLRKWEKMQFGAAY